MKCLILATKLFLKQYEISKLENLIFQYINPTIWQAEVCFKSVSKWLVRSVFHDYGKNIKPTFKIAILFYIFYIFTHLYEISGNFLDSLQ